MILLSKGIGVVGSTTIDEIVSPDQRIKKIGGATAYAGITYSRHAVNTIVISNLAPVDHEIIKRLEREKLTVFTGKTDRTTHFINHIEGDPPSTALRTVSPSTALRTVSLSNGRRQEVFNRARPILLRHLLPALKHVDALHLSPLHPDDIEPKLLTELPQFGLKVFIDIQGYTRKVIKKDVSAAVSRHLPDALKVADIIKANEFEIKLVLEYFQKDLPQIMKTFQINEAVITLGEKGGWVESAAGERFEYNARRVDNAIDSTGAGDVFFAAYLLSRFIENRNIARACQYAAVIAARQVEGSYISFDRLVLA